LLAVRHPYIIYFKGINSSIGFAQASTRKQACAADVGMEDTASLFLLAV
jgi:hypothetical protein